MVNRILLILFLMVTPALAGDEVDVTLSWERPMQREDGSPIDQDEILRYELYSTLYLKCRYPEEDFDWCEYSYNILGNTEIVKIAGEYYNFIFEYYQEFNANQTSVNYSGLNTDFTYYVALRAVDIDENKSAPAVIILNPKSTAIQSPLMCSSTVNP